MDHIFAIIAQELDCDARSVENVASLLDAGNTIPFIARYRKEAHGGMDDTRLRRLQTRLDYLRSLQARRIELRALISAQTELTDELSAAIEHAETLSALEDIYRPYRPKRRTRATMAKEKGLEPLADEIFAQRPGAPRPEVLAERYVSAEKGVECVQDALAGASDILAERFSDDAAIRGDVRALLWRSARLCSRAAGEEDSVYRLYYDFSQPVSKLQGHQILALDRGEREGFLKVTLEQDEPAAVQAIRRRAVRPGSPAMALLAIVAQDCFDRLLAPSLEREARAELTQRACAGAIENFALNLRPLLMQPPVRGSVTMGLDPGYAHGCKVAVVDATGKVLDTTVVYQIGRAHV